MPCIPCHEAKQKIFPFENSDSHADTIFQLIHVDLSGSYKSKTITGASYFLTIVNDHSRAVWTFLLADKTQVFQTISNFLTYVKTQFQTCVKNIGTDNGSKFLNNKCQNLFLTSRIIHQKTVA